MTTTTTSAHVDHETADPRVERTLHVAEQIVDAAVDVGRSWAAYGLRIGKLALETHAHTMGRIADALHALEQAIDDRAEAREASAGVDRAAEPAREPGTPASSDASAEPSQPT